MRMEHWILVAMWLFGLIGLFLIIPRKDWRKRFFAFMVFQAIIWLCDMPSFKFNLLSAPVRVLPKATDLALTINYVFYPALFSIYYVNKKVKDSLWRKIRYLFIWVSAITLFDIVIERYTDLLEYGYITWYWMWLYIGFLFYVSHVCCNWFFKYEATFVTDDWVKPSEN